MRSTKNSDLTQDFSFILSSKLELNANILIN